MPIAINGSGTLTGISVGGLPDGIVDADMLAANAVTAAKLATGVGGKILQVVQTIKTNAFSTNATSMTDVTGMNVAITPSSASSKVLITVSISVGGEHSAIVGINLLRGSSVVAAGDANASNHNLVTFGAATNGNSSAGSGKYQSETHSYTFLDSPNTTSATTYKIQVNNVRASQNEYVVINSPYQGGHANDNSAYVINTTSTMTAMEVAA
tara:strand:- start:659 stop:1291 length:633 start_codon:yes stop_codon:yes gene_type:complete